MKYKIKYYYSTGNSFGSEDRSDILELEWDYINVAKANLRRIKEHYKYYKCKNETRNTYMSKFYKDEIEYCKKIEDEKPDWLVTTGNSFDSYHCIILYADNNRPFQFWAPWCGYFERLHSAEIILPEDDDLSFEV